MKTTKEVVRLHRLVTKEIRGVQESIKKIKRQVHYLLMYEEVCKVDDSESTSAKKEWMQLERVRDLLLVQERRLARTLAEIEKGPSATAEDIEDALARLRFLHREH